MKPALSILDQSPVLAGHTPAEAIPDTLELAKLADRLGYTRYWLSEHHNSEALAGSAPEILVSAIAATTRRIRVGPAGIMLPHYSALKVAEQFRVLSAIAPGRIDLGLGRAPGADGRLAHALRKDLMRAAESFPSDVVELRALFTGEPELQLRATPGYGAQVELWMLGSSLFGAQLAAMLGLPYAFASHFAPGDLDQAVQLYRERFQPTEFGEKPRFMLAVNVIAAETDDQARRLRSSQQISFARLRLGTPGLLPPPVDDIHDAVPMRILPTVQSALSISAVGSPATVAAQLDQLIAKYRPDELILVGNIFDQAARHKSFGIAAEILRGRT